MPILDEFFAWLKSQKLVKNALDRDIKYALYRWQYRECYILDGRLGISNNCAERSIKPFVIDYKNFLFANTPRVSYTRYYVHIIETAEEHGLNIYEYLTSLFIRVQPTVIARRLKVFHLIALQ